MTLPRSSRDREQQKFREPSLDKVSVAVTIEQEAGSTVPVTITGAGVATNNYSEVTSVASGATVDVLTYTVPVGNTFSLSKASASGDNYAEFTIEIDNNTQDKKRTYWCDFNAIFDVGGLVVAAGSIIKVTVNNFRPTTSDFNARIFGNLL